MSDANFDWKSESGDKFAKANPSNAEETDARSINYCGVSVTQLFEEVTQILESKGLEKSSAKIFDIGCSTGGKLSVLEKIGFPPENLFGVDMSPMAIQILSKDHPQYHSKEIHGYEYGTCFDQVDSFDLVYHCAVMCQVPLEDYDLLFSGIRALRPKFYMFMEGINPRGYEKLPNSLLHGHGHGHKHGHHDHGKGHHHKHGHLHEEERKHEDEQVDLAEILDEGFHHVNNVEQVVSERYPEAKLIFKRKLNYTEEAAPKFQADHFDYFMLSLYELS